MTSKPVVNSGHYQILGTDTKENCEDSFDSAYQKYREEWKQRPIKFQADNFPLHLDIESTNNCNLKCTMCTRNFMKEKIGFMKWDLYKKIIDEAAKHKLPSIKLNYRGEPLMHPDLIKMVKYAKNNGIIEVQFNTNGLLLDEEISRELIKAGIDRIIFSFDGATKETYEKIRTGSNFEKVMGNIKRFVDIKNLMGKKRPCTRIQMVKTKENVHEINKFISMWTPVVNRVAISTRREPQGNKKENEHFPCPQIWQRMVVCWDGDVRACCGDWHGEIKLGDANKQDIYEIWHSKKYEWLRKMHSSGKFNDISVCEKCEVNTPRKDASLMSRVN
jgi:radical SAM protein with 4Fe4S-binding SPASM domain